MPKFAIWSYKAGSLEQRHGAEEGETFTKACEKFAQRNSFFGAGFNKEWMTYKGRQLRALKLT